MKTLFLALALTLPLSADTLLPSDLGPAGSLPQGVRHGSLRVLARAGGNLFRSELPAWPQPPLPLPKHQSIVLESVFSLRGNAGLMLRNGSFSQFEK